VKLYADEPGHQAVRALEGLIVCSIARVEVPAALWRKERLGELGAEDAEVLVAAFEADYLGTMDEPALFAAVEIGPALLDEAAALTATLALRAHDAVHLASALLAREADPACRQFACFDEQLRVAAARSGFAPVPT
jgi:predicted nucleic acid-binding protein